MHPTAERLYEAAKNLKGIEGQSALARFLNETPQVVKNWEARGVSKQGMLKAQEKIGCSAVWIKDGDDYIEGQVIRPALPAKPLIDAEEHGFLPIQHAALIVKAGIDGFTVDHIDDMKPPIFFREDWYRDNGYKPEKMLAVSVSGESMWPKMSPGDVVIINTASNQPIDGKVFVVNYEGEVVIKRLTRDAGQWWLASDNPNKQRYPNKLCAGDYCLVIGEVVYLQTRSI